MILSHIVAAARHGVIGKDGGMPWHLPADLKHFRALTMGKVIVMGRRTYESIGKALPGRYSIVLSKVGLESVPAEVAVLADWAAVVPEIQRRQWPNAEIMIIGGASLYALTMPLVQCIYMTEIDLAPAGDTFYPPVPPTFVESERVLVAGTPQLSFVTLRLP